MTWLSTYGTPISAIQESGGDFLSLGAISAGDVLKRVGDNIEGAALATDGANWVNIKDYGAAVDGVTDDASAIQTAIDTEQAKATPSTLFFPAGISMVSAPLTFSSATPITFQGDGMNASFIRASGAMSALFNFSTNTRAAFKFRDLYLDGNSNANYGIYGEAMQYTHLERVNAQSCLEAGVAMGYGWLNNCYYCNFSNNTLDGLRLIVNSNNGVNLVGCTMLSNGRFGMVDYGGYSLEMLGCLLDGNVYGGIFFAMNRHAAALKGCGFEANATSAWTFTGSGSFATQSDIIFSGSSTLTEIGLTYPSKGVLIEACFFDHPEYYADGSIFAGAVQGLDLVNNVGYTPDSGDLPYLLSIHNTYWGAVDVNARGSRGFKRKLLINGINNNALHRGTQLDGWDWDDPTQNSVHELNTTLSGGAETSVVLTENIPTEMRSQGTITIELDSGSTKDVVYTSYTAATFTIGSTDFTGANEATAGVRVFLDQITTVPGNAPKNYFSQDINDLATIKDNSNPAAVTRASDMWNGSDIWDMASVANTSDVMGQTIDVDANPELADAYVCFSVRYKMADGAANLNLYCYDSGGTLVADSTQSGAGHGRWTREAIVVQMPPSGSYKFGFGKMVADASAVQIAQPVLAIVGYRHGQFRTNARPTYRGSAAPTAGTWVTGDIVYDTTPSASGNIGWVCTSGGAPGTWKAFGAIAA